MKPMCVRCSQKPSRARQLCRSCYDREMRQPKKVHITNKDLICSCGAQARCKGMCNPCYRKQLRVTRKENNSISDYELTAEARAYYADMWLFVRDELKVPQAQPRGRNGSNN